MKSKILLLQIHSLTVETSEKLMKKRITTLSFHVYIHAWENSRNATTKSLIKAQARIVR